MILCSNDAVAESEAFEGKFQYMKRQPSLFSLVLHIVRHYTQRLECTRGEYVCKITATEAMTDRGWINPTTRGDSPEERFFSHHSEVAIHTQATQARSNTLAAEFQLRLTDFLCEAHRQYFKLLEDNDSIPCRIEQGQKSALRRRFLAIHEALRAHQSKVKGLIENFIYWQARANTQTREVNLMTVDH